MMLDSQNFTGRIQAKTTQLQTCATLQGKGRMTDSTALSPHVKPQATETASQALQLNETCPAGFHKYLGPVTPFFPLLFSPFWNKNIYNSYHMPVLWEQITSSLLPQLQRWSGILPQSGSYPESHCSPSVHGISQARILERVVIPFSRGQNPHLLHWQADSLPSEPPQELIRQEGPPQIFHG